MYNKRHQKDWSGHQILQNIWIVKGLDSYYNWTATFVGGALNFSRLFVWIILHSVKYNGWLKARVMLSITLTLL